MEKEREREGKRERNTEGERGRNREGERDYMHRVGLTKRVSLPPLSLSISFSFFSLSLFSLVSLALFRRF